MISKPQVQLQNRRPRRRQAAFSIMEATMAMAVVGICSVALFSGFTGGYFNIQLSRENVRATQIMLEKTETLRLYSWDQISTNTYILPTFDEPYDPNAPAGSQGLTYHGSVRLDPMPIDASYTNEMRMVTVQLDWHTGGIQRHRQFITYVAEHGLQNYIY